MVMLIHPKPIPLFIMPFTEYIIDILFMGDV